jgi:hypothetical protein
MKKLVWSFVAVALGVTALNIVSAQSPGVGLTALPSVTPLGPELIFAWQTGTGGSGATACSGGYCPVTITPSALKTFIGSGSSGGGGSGTVTSVNATGSGILSFSGGPITTSGSLSANWSGTSGGIPCFTGIASLSSSSILTANQLLIGGGSGSCPFPLGNLGSSTTVLHGNASGSPSFSAVSLNTDVSGYLPLTSKTETGAYQFVLTDANQIKVTENCGSACTVTLPAYATVAFGNDVCLVLWALPGSATVTLAPAAGVTLTLVPTGSTGNRTLTAPANAWICSYGSAGANTWEVGGPGVT